MTDCNPHPDAPHGFDRQASHNEDRYVCDCESWFDLPTSEVNRTQMKRFVDESRQDDCPEEAALPESASDLRTKLTIIAQAHIFCIVECSCGQAFPAHSIPDDNWRTNAEWDWSAHVADVVIRELRLKREELGGFRIPGYGHRGHRYVTEWKADE